MRIAHFYQNSYLTFFIQSLCVRTCLKGAPPANLNGESYSESLKFPLENFSVESDNLLLKGLSGAILQARAPRAN